jgi:predicted phage terminase large subunit-like protein
MATKNGKTINIQPQPGPQESFLSTPADIAVYGGSAGSGKTFAALLEPLRHYKNKDFGCIIFRRTTPQISAEGGLWDEAGKVYPLLGARMRENPFRATFPSGAKVEFRSLQHDKNVFDYQGSQIPLIIFDEMTHFSWKMFTYMMSRNRSACGVNPYIRATCNPDPDHWLRKFISWYIDKNTGYPIPERSGVIRYFIIQNDEVIWGDSKQDLIKYVELSDEAKKQGHTREDLIKSFTFIMATIYDNQALLSANPEYLATLNALPLVEKEQLLKGNWKIKRAAGLYFKREWFEIVHAKPAKIIRSVRYWDRAATEPSSDNPDPDWTVGLRMHLLEDGSFYVDDLRRFRGTPNKVLRAIKYVAGQDGQKVGIWLEEDPGQAGKSEVYSIIAELAGYNVRPNRVNKSKATRALPASAQSEAGNIKIKKAPWNGVFFNELESFPPEKNKGHDDIVDGFSGAFNMLTIDNIDAREKVDYDKLLTL